MGKAESTEKKPNCFVVSPIGAPASADRKHADIVLRHIIKPVLRDMEFEDPVRADAIEPGLITRQIVSQLLNADLVIADLTGQNPNVFYELAIRHGTGKPFVQMIYRGQSIPFDVGAQRTIQFDWKDPDDIEACKNELKLQVQAVMKTGFVMETPIGHALDYDKLRGGDTTEKVLSTIIDRLDRIEVTSRHAAYPNAYATVATYYEGDVLRSPGVPGVYEGLIASAGFNPEKIPPTTLRILIEQLHAWCMEEKTHPGTRMLRRAIKLALSNNPVDLQKHLNLMKKQSPPDVA